VSYRVGPEILSDCLKLVVLAIYMLLMLVSGSVCAHVYDFHLHPEQSFPSCFQIDVLGIILQMSHSFFYMTAIVYFLHWLGVVC